MAENVRGKAFTRRNVLKVLAGAAGIVAHRSNSSLQATETSHCAMPAKSALVNLASSAGSAPQFFSSSELRTVAALCEAIIPADDHSPGATAAGVPAYADTILGSAGEGRRSQWKAGLAMMDGLAEKEFSRKFADCEASQRDQILSMISANEEHPASAEEKFFVAAKHMTIEGYYNSQVGLDQDLQFVGNEALAEFEGCTHPEHGAPPAGKP